MLKFLKRRWWLIAGGIILLGAAAWFWYSRSQDKAEVKTVQPQMSDVRQTLSFSGRVDAKERVSMYFAGGGKLTYLGAKEGDLVKKWQTLASIDSRSVQKTLERTLNLYDTERLGFENDLDDRKDRVLDQEEQRVAQQKQNSLDRSIIDVELHSLAIEDTRLSTPIAGVLVAAPVRVIGGQVGPTDRFDVVNPETLYFRLYVDEVDVDQIFVGQESTVRLDARSGEALSGVVEKIAYQSIDSALGTVFPVDIRFLDSVSIENQRVGMNGDAELLLEQAENVMTVPLAAVYTTDGKQFVRVLKDGKQEERQVEVGLEDDTVSEIKSGLSLEDHVVLP